MAGRPRNWRPQPQRSRPPWLAPGPRLRARLSPTGSGGRLRHAPHGPLPSPTRLRAVTPVIAAISLVPASRPSREGRGGGARARGSAAEQEFSHLDHQSRFERCFGAGAGADIIFPRLWHWHWHSGRSGYRFAFWRTWRTIGWWQRTRDLMYCSYVR